MGPGPFWKRFRANFCEFTELLVRQMHCSALCDGQLVDTVICMLTGLTTSAVHSLRHTSSLAGEATRRGPACLEGLHTGPGGAAITCAAPVPEGGVHTWGTLAPSSGQGQGARAEARGASAGRPSRPELQGVCRKETLCRVGRRAHPFPWPVEGASVSDHVVQEDAWEGWGCGVSGVSSPLPRGARAGSPG